MHANKIKPVGNLGRNEAPGLPAQHGAAANQGAYGITTVAERGGDHYKNLVVPDAPLTMSSREIAELTDKEHKNVLADIRKMLTELGKAAAEFSATAQVAGPNGSIRAIEVFELPKRETLVLVSGYSLTLRARIIDRWQELEDASTRPALPNFNDPVAAARAWADQAEQKQIAIAQRDEAVRTKAQIGSRREATAMAAASAAVREVKKLKAELGAGALHATLTAVCNAFDIELDDRHAWRPLKAWCREHGVAAKEVTDPRWGVVKAWPAAAWLAVYGINLSDQFGANEE